MKIIAAFTLSALVLGMPLRAQDNVPYLVNYQGRLTNAAGQSMEDGNYKLRFELYSKRDSSQAGDALIWGRDYTVAVVSGQFNVVLGAEGGNDVGGAAVIPLKFAFVDPERYLQITVLTDKAGAALATPQTIAPRQQILAAPYAIQAQNGVPAGTIVPFAGETAPPGWAVCDGSVKSGSDFSYSALFAAIGKRFGNGDSSDKSFNLPDLRGRTVVGSGIGPGLSARQLGQQVGSETHTLTINEIPSHDHGGLTSIAGAHSHSTSGKAASDDGGSSDTHFTLGDSDAGRSWPGITVSTSGDHRHSITPQGGGSPHNIVQPSLVLNYIIKL